MPPKLKPRRDIVEDGVVHCPAFTVPLIDFGDLNESDDDAAIFGGGTKSRRRQWFADYPSIVAAKKKWKKLYEIILDKKSVIPLKQMAIKKKHEDLIFDKM